MIALFVLGCAMQHVRSLMLDQESSLCSLQGNHGVLTTRHPGKSPIKHFRSSQSATKDQTESSI